ncbi:ATP-binding protein [Stenotrophomonas sp. HITSZ_GD]|uniref:ATP-binding protein n=1 Tax=Stenotrophomonas sp. HITSZ_GD TaxID=3037248 RepID=UPI00240D85CB|nr:ATP-binding protein [Stenotrophomonas sp. HITSZ_GD]MDG2524576.1 ATP-binding protein [Stenotrophomonas sp. HITSZ_GD]
MSIRVGEVVAISGIRITLRIDEESNKETLFHEGQRYKGISIREHIAIQRGFKDIVCIVEGEQLDEKKFELDGDRTQYIRKIEVRPIGYFEGDTFKHGVKFLPMIKDAAFLLNEARVLQIYETSKAGGLTIGRMLKEDLPVRLPWHRLFNSHIGIFGNTGSGKSNTLAKLFTTLFEERQASILGKSQFVIIDFNGEYTGNQLTTQKRSYHLSTNPSNSLFYIDQEEFWNSDTLSLLFQATQNTQRPFLTRLVEGRRLFGGLPNSLSGYAQATFKKVFSSASPRPESLELLRRICRIAGSATVESALQDISWNATLKNFFRRTPNRTIYFDADGLEYAATLEQTVLMLDLSRLSAFDELIVRVHIQLTRELQHGFVQFDHIQPLVKRMESLVGGLQKVIAVGRDPLSTSDLVSVISLKRCNTEIKKVVPLLLAQHFYQRHKAQSLTPPERTTHLIIDEAHNILSQQSTREHESWRDYRLEMFEEIIKEGRKFGFFLTVSSQRPADISPTIVSQLHNFFIHRLVNDRDLFLIDNTLSTLDALSRALVPTLAQGCCVATGTAFELPLVMQVEQLARGKSPDSEDVNLSVLWS